MLKLALLSSVVLSALLFQLNAAPAPLAIGSPMPEVTQVNQEGKPIALHEIAAEGYTVFFFYPKAHTGGCTQQACSMRDAFGELQAKGVKVFGVSGDKQEDQASFKEKQSLPYDLLADTDGKVAAALGVPANNGRPKRTALLFKDGKLVWQDPKGSTGGQAEAVLAQIK